MGQITKTCLACGVSFSVPPSKSSKRTCSRECRDHARSFESTFSLLVKFSLARGLLPTEIPQLPDPQDRLRYADGEWYWRIDDERFIRLSQGPYDHKKREWALLESDPIDQSAVPPHKPPQEVAQ